MDIIEIRLPKEFETVEIYPLSDLHIGDPKVDKRLFREFIKHILEKPNRFLIYNGDNMNNAIKSSVSNVYNEEMTPREQKKWLKENLKPVADRFLAFVAGNHEERTAKETDQSIVEDIAEYLGKADVYRDDEAYIKLSSAKGQVAAVKCAIQFMLCMAVVVAEGPEVHSTTLNYLHWEPRLTYTSWAMFMKRSRTKTQ